MIKYPFDSDFTAATIGFFDGVHLGHQYLIGQLKKMAEERHLQAHIITFDEHPRKILNHDFRPKLLTSEQEKIDLMLKMGVESLVMFPFTTKFAELTAAKFMKLLYDDNVRFLLLGYDHHFGSDGLRDFADYERIGRQTGIEVKKLDQYQFEGQHVSSSAIRKLLELGDIAAANRLLGYQYSLTGEVVDGRHLGRTLGFPTANLRLSDPEKVVPAVGVYAVKVKVDDQTYRGMLNIGNCPTVDGKNCSIEVHLLDFQSDLYGKTLKVRFVKRLRDEIKFDSISELRAQLEQDAASVKSE